ADRGEHCGDDGQADAVQPEPRSEPRQEAEPEAEGRLASGSASCRGRPESDFLEPFEVGGGQVAHGHTGTSCGWSSTTSVRWAPMCAVFSHPRTPTASRITARTAAPARIHW